MLKSLAFQKAFQNELAGRAAFLKPPDGAVAEALRPGEIMLFEDRFHDADRVAGDAGDLNLGAAKRGQPRHSRAA